MTAVASDWTQEKTCTPRKWSASDAPHIVREYPQNHEWEWQTSEYRAEGWEVCRRCGASTR